jgi:hypothetical protein
LYIAAWTTWRWERFLKLLFSKKTSKDSTSIVSNRGLRNDITRHKKNIITALVSNIDAPKFVSISSHGKGHILKLDEQKLMEHMNEMIESLKKEYAPNFQISVIDCILHPKPCLSEAIQFGSNVLERIKESIYARKAKQINNFDTISSKGSNYEYFGKSITRGDFNGDGIEDIAIGSPGYSSKIDPNSNYVESRTGRVYVKFGPLNDSQDFFTSSLVQLDCDEDASKFGWSVLSVDMNKDGIDDLVISAPSGSSRYDEQDYPHAHYRGAVYIYFGKKGKLFESNQKSDVVIMGKDHQEISSFGFLLKTFDIDQDGFNDLIIGSPFAYGGNGLPGQEGGDPNPYADKKVCVSSLLSNQ